MPETPTLDRLAAEDARRSAAHEFLDWLHAKGYHLGRYTPSGRLGPAFTKDDLLVLQWLGIDPAAVERERRALLSAAQEAAQAARRA